MFASVSPAHIWQLPIPAGRLPVQAPTVLLRESMPGDPVVGEPVAHPS